MRGKPEVIGSSIGIVPTNALYQVRSPGIVGKERSRSESKAQQQRISPITGEELQVKFVSDSRATALNIEMVGPWRLELQTSTVSKGRYYVLPTT